MEADRRRAALALAPLTVIAMGLFVPPIVHTLPHVEAISPWKDGWQWFWWVHLAAALLAALGAIAAWRRTEPGSLITAAAGIAIVGSGYVPVRFLQFAWTDQLPALVVLFAAELAGGLALLVLAWRATGWTRWIRLLGAYAILVVHYGCPWVAGMVNAFSGGVTFIAALATLLVLVTRSFIAIR